LAQSPKKEKREEYEKEKNSSQNLRHFASPTFPAGSENADRDRENARLIDNFLPIVLKRFERQQIPWTIDNGVYRKGLVSHEEFKHQVRASEHVGGDELQNVTQMLRTLARPMLAEGASA
jgi:hypothetical protein